MAITDSRSQQPDSAGNITQRTKNSLCENGKLGTVWPPKLQSACNCIVQSPACFSTCTPWPAMDLWDLLAALANKHSTTISISVGVSQGSPGSRNYGTDHALAWRAEWNRCCGIQTASIDTGWLVLREQLLISPRPTPLEHFSHIDLAFSSPHTLSPDSNYHPGKIISITQINQKRVVSFLC